MLKTPKELIDLGLAIGKKTPFWVQGAGGNISYFDSEKDQFWIKASGTRLDQIDKPTSCALMPFNKSIKLLEQLKTESRHMTDSDVEKNYSEILTTQSIKSELLGRPSMETGFHIFTSHNIVMHFHALSSLVMAFEQNRVPKELAHWLKENFPKLNIVFIKPIRPGFRLAAEIADFADQDIFILENHGVIIQGDSIEILNNWHELEKKFMKDFGYHELLNFTDLSLVSSIEKLSYKLTGELKIYFPDSAVFFNDLQQLLVPLKNNQFTLKKEQIESILKTRETKNLKLLEIWTATVILQKTSPELSELPNSIASEVAGLPTEQYRKALNK